MAGTVKIDDFIVGPGNPLALIAGPCVLESEEVAFKTAEKVKELTQKYNVPYIFKSSYLKANRLNINSYTGPGLDQGLEILAKLKKEFDIPVLTDIHSKDEVKPVSEVVDILQIPAFLCRQTDLVIEAAKTKKPLNIKKGQFLAPEDMKSIAEKAESVGNNQILLTERGTTFGYHNLVVDMRSLVIMRGLGYPVVFDATHSLQLPGGAGNSSGGQPQFILPLARAAVACGCDAIFVETHPNPGQALCDKASMLPLEKMEELLLNIRKVEEALRN
ncbi:MAG: 3-deoxy-8-phosphooctulonate synthase [Candidatus Zixiibacteriota bacterium]